MEGGEEERIKGRGGRKGGNNKERSAMSGFHVNQRLVFTPIPQYLCNYNVAHLCPCCQGNLHDPLLAEVALIGGGGSDTVSLVCLQVDIQTQDGGMKTAHTKENSRHVVVQGASMTILANDL